MTNPTDRELLEMAARAAGIELTYRHGSDSYYYDDPETGCEQWYPLGNDAQALRLAVKLRMVVSLASCCCCACVDWAGNEDENEIYIRFGEEWKDREATDAQSATRRAIVRAAAAIGERQ